MFEPDLELRIEVFRKMGAEIYQINDHSNLRGWKLGNKIIGTGSFSLVEYAAHKLPPIETTWEVCAEFLVPFMNDKSQGYSITSIEDRIGMEFTWHSAYVGRGAKAEIKDDNIALAACEAFLEVEL